MVSQSTHKSKRPWQLVANVGGTNARFAVADLVGRSLLHTTYYSVAKHEVFADVLADFCASVARDSAWKHSRGPHAWGLLGQFATLRPAKP